MNDVSKQPSLIPAPQPAQVAEEASYEWSTIRVVEGVTVNVVSALLIGLGGIIIAALYALIALIASALHAPSELLGLVSLFILGGILTLVIVIIVMWAFVRRTPPSVAAGMLIGAVIGAAIAVALEKEGGIARFSAKHLAQTQMQKQKEDIKTASGSFNK